MTNPADSFAPASGIAPTGGTPYRGSCERVTLALAKGKYCAIPGEPSLGGGASVGDEAGTSAINSEDQAYLDPPLPLPQRSRTDGPVRAIAIAADSPIYCADLWLGDTSSKNRHRISVGRPWVGDARDLADARVTLPRAIPNPFQGSAETQAQFVARNLVWDSDLGTQGAVSPLLDRADFSFPLRLELYRGDLLPLSSQIRRASYCADSWFDETANPYHRLWVVTDGRSQIEVVVSNQSDAGNAILVTVTGHDPSLTRHILAALGAAELRRQLNSFTIDTQAVAQGASWKRTYTEPFALYSVRVEPADLTPGAGKCRGSIAVVARDA